MGGKFLENESLATDFAETQKVDELHNEEWGF